MKTGLSHSADLHGGVFAEETKPRSEREAVVGDAWDTDVKRTRVDRLWLGTLAGAILKAHHHEGLMSVSFNAAVATDLP